MGVPDDSNITPLHAQPPYANLADLKPIVCLIVFSPETTSPFYETVLLPALRQVLEQTPYFWRVVHSNDKTHKDNPQHNITAWMEQAEIYIVDVSEQDPDTFIELGRICEKQKGTNGPIIVLERKRDDRSKMSPRDEIMRISYNPPDGEKHAVEDLVDELSKEFGRRENIRVLNKARQAHYLSPLILMSVAAIQEDIARLLANKYVTMEYFVKVLPKHIAAQVRGLSANMAKSYQQEISDLLHDIQNQ